ncbi:YlbF family regulator [Thermolongibacillus altinsuensis]
MSMTVLEAAQNLEEAIRHSQPFAQLRQAYAEIQRDSATRQMFEHFRSMQQEIQTKQMNGFEVTEAEIEALQRAMASIEANGKLGKLIQAEQRLNELFAQVTNAMFRPIEDLYAGRS